MTHDLTALLLSCRSDAAADSENDATESKQNDAEAGVQLAQALAAAGREVDLDQLQSFTCNNNSATVPPLLQVGVPLSVALSLG